MPGKVASMGGLSESQGHLNSEWGSPAGEGESGPRTHVSSFSSGSSFEDQPSGGRGTTARVSIEKTFVELNGSVFYEFKVENLRALARDLATRDQEGEEDGEGGGWGLLTGAQALPSGPFTFVRRYKHFRSFHWRLASAVKDSNSNLLRGRSGGLWADPRAITLPRIPPRQIQLMVDHCSTAFVTRRARALEKYLAEVLSHEGLARLILGHPELLRWVSDCPRPFYALSSARDCPLTYRNFTILSCEDVATWGSQSDGHDGRGRNGGGMGQGRPAPPGWFERDDDSYDEESELEWTDPGPGLAMPMKEVRISFATPSASGGGRMGTVQSAPTPDSAPMPVDLFGAGEGGGLNGKLSLWKGNIWQLRVDALCVDAPGDYQPVPGTTFAEVVRMAGVAAIPQLKVLDECRIGDVVAVPCVHGLNLPARWDARAQCDCLHCSVGRPNWSALLPLLH